MYEPVPNIYNRPTYRQSSPKKTVDSSDYLQKMYSDMERIDRQLEMVAKIEGDDEKAAIAKFDEDEENNSENYELESPRGNESTSLKFKESDKKFKKMENMMRDVNQQSDELQKLLR